MEGTVKCSANYIPLTPISFLERSAIVYRDRISVVYGDSKFTWAETRDRCARLASALHSLGISRHDVVSYHLILGYSGFLCYSQFTCIFFLSNSFFFLISMLPCTVIKNPLIFLLLVSCHN
ncbi:unnamed protein product [Coffea canephora]|uniref:DH200=94 genomic scaffold, scaffold_688 n=1 Tax=Coffea canephora TaxID=49390 RepID=A0A068VGF8_COFCA|nr:unnamed protein product [Coffea canephora]